MAAFGLEEAGTTSRALDAGLARRRAQPRRRVGDPRRRAHLRDARPRRRGHPLPQLRPHAMGERQPVHRPQLVAPRACTSSRPGAPSAHSTSTTRSSTTQRSAGVPIEMLDASALLWRLLPRRRRHRRTVRPLADAWAPKVAGESWYAFNDLHAVMAFAGAGRHGDIRSAPARSASVGWTDVGGSNARMTAEIGLPACRAVLAFVEDRHDDVIAELMPIRRHAAPLRWLARATRCVCSARCWSPRSGRGATTSPAPSPPNDSAFASRASTAGPNGRERCAAWATRPRRQQPSNGRRVPGQFATA